MDIKIPYYDDNTRISNSSLNWFRISPKYFREKLDGKIANDSSSAMDNGTMRHSYLLQQNEFKKLYKILDFSIPTSAQQKQFCLDYINSKLDKPILKASEAFKSNYSTKGSTEEDIAAKGLEMALKLKSYIKWLRTKDSETKTMTWSQFSSLKIMKENVKLHKKANELVLTEKNSPEYITQNEFHINWEFPIKTGDKQRVVSCKSLLDRLEIDHENKIVKLIDIKTTISLSKFGKSFEEYNYGQQMAYYWMAIYWYFANELKVDIGEYEHQTYIVAIENGSNEVRVFDVPDETIIAKSEEIKQILTNIDWHIEHNLWDFTKEYYEGDGVESLLYDI